MWYKQFSIFTILFGLTFACIAGQVCFSNATTRTLANPAGTPVSVVWFGWDGDQVFTIKNEKDPNNDNSFTTWCVQSSGCAAFKLTINDLNEIKGGTLGVNCQLGSRTVVGSYLVNASTDGDISHVFIIGPVNNRY
jgi:hypothetical protein